MAEQGKGLYDNQYTRFRENQGTHKGYDFQHGPAGSTPPPVVTFMDKIKWWTLRGWRRKKILAERDRFQQDIIQIKAPHPKERIFPEGYSRVTEKRIDPAGMHG